MAAIDEINEKYGPPTIERVGTGAPKVIRVIVHTDRGLFVGTAMTVEGAARHALELIKS